ncbi:selenophosphate synthase [Alkalicoccus daliensis]|uniref:Selenide, water dikinase n=1 Tax=Alkalicoccus daliensis TaxID=745820 RepID=A0A1H0AEN3_9BACI|nr:selenophosphate synthase [Alkalicoccus daliensis]
MGIDTKDDAGVYKLTDEIALVQTVDYFTPIVDDPYDFGQIAAANALSDVYAMGGKPATVLNIVGFPIKKLPPDMLASILLGASDKVKESGAVLAGGHSIDDPEPKFGLSCTGIVHPDRIFKNVGSKPGEVLVLTKPLGVGIMTTAIKANKTTQMETRAATKVMAELNKTAAEKLEKYHPSAVTDVTGFGLVGHGYEMASGSNVSFQLDFNAVPFLPGTERLAKAGIIPGGTKENLEWLKDEVSYADTLKYHERASIADSITSGGLLVSMDPEEAEHYIQDMEDSLYGAHIVGKVIEPGDKTVYVTQNNN